MVLPLADFCQDLHRYGAMIEAPQNWMPTCNQPLRGGLHVALSPDGNTYVVTYTEKADTEVIVASSDKDQVLEAIFDGVTLNMAAEGLAREAPPVGPGSPAEITPANVGKLRTMAIAAHLKLRGAQEDLLGRLNPVWRDRQAARNGEQLKRIESMLDE